MRRVTSGSPALFRSTATLSATRSSPTNSESLSSAPGAVPPPMACLAERKMHVALLSDPKVPVTASQLAAIVDARENWQMMIAWRDHLVKHCTLEAAYLDIVRNNIKFPHAEPARCICETCWKIATMSSFCGPPRCSSSAEVAARRVCRRNTTRRRSRRFPRSPVHRWRNCWDCL